ncbi:prolyl oligopeptidase family protein, partial [Vibrio parahaemolyticus V-223/04]
LVLVARWSRERLIEILSCFQASCLKCLLLMW